MSGREIAREFIERALEDLRALENMLDVGIFADSVFGFHAQQASEKLLKAWLAFVSNTYPKTHDISRLIEELQAHGENADSCQPLVYLSPYGVRFRYGARADDEAPLEREEYLEIIHGLLENTRVMMVKHES